MGYEANRLPHGYPETEDDVSQGDFEATYNGVRRNFDPFPNFSGIQPGERDHRFPPEMTRATSYHLPPPRSYRPISTEIRPVRQFGLRRDQEVDHGEEYRPPQRTVSAPVQNRSIMLTPEELVTLLGSSRNSSEGCSKRRHSLFKMKKFSGDIEMYPIWRQDLLICLDREAFTSERDKALFLYKNLEGEAEHQVSHFLRPLSDESFAGMMRTLDLLYGTEFDLDRLLVRKLSKMPKLETLTRDTLGKMIITLNAAIPALRRREPESLRSTNSDRLVQVLGILPQVDRTMFLFACRSQGLPANLQNLAAHLEDYLQILKETDRPKDGVRKEGPRIPKPAPARRRTVYLTQPRSDWEDWDSEEEIDIKLSNQETQKAPPEPTARRASQKPAVQTKQESRDDRPFPDRKPRGDRPFPDRKPRDDRPLPACPLCREKHSLAFCEQFKAMSLDDKRDLVFKTRTCVACLFPGHYARDCKRAKKCSAPKCESLHHPLLHDKEIARMLYMEDYSEYPLEEDLELQDSGESSCDE